MFGAVAQYRVDRAIRENTSNSVALSIRKVDTPILSNSQPFWTRKPGGGRGPRSPS